MLEVHIMLSRDLRWSLISWKLVAKRRGSLDLIQGRP